MPLLLGATWTADHLLWKEALLRARGDTASFQRSSGTVPAATARSMLMAAWYGTHRIAPGAIVLGYGARLWSRCDTTLARQTGLRLLLKEALCS
jgi:hypothetical protein